MALACVLMLAACGDGSITRDAGLVDAATIDAAPVDEVAPVVGGGPTFSALAATSLTVSWDAATDDVSYPAELRYKVVRASGTAAIDTLPEVHAITGADLVLDWTADTLTVDVEGLTPATGYAFAVVVEDAAGNQALYAPAAVTTLDASAPTVGTGITFASVAATSVTVSWGAASDDITAATALQYKVVRAASASSIDSLAEVDAITSGAGLVLDFTADATSAPATGLTTATTYAFAVVVRDAAGNEALYAPAVVTTLDDGDPTVTITAPTAAASFTTAAASVALAGSAADNVAVTSVTWANAANATSGTATGTTSWSVAGVTLAVGGNVITVTASDAAGNTATDTITVTRDDTDPTVTITGPSAAATFTTASSSIPLAGSASDNENVVSVTWANAANATGGSATGTTTWSVGAVTLAAGDNVITVTATDDAGNTSTDAITVTCDDTDPTVSIDQAGGQADPTNGSPITFTVAFSEPVTGFTNGDISTTGSTATVGTIIVTGGPSTYNVAITATGNGVITATVSASGAQDAAGNLNAASTSTDNTVTLDTSQPTVTINQAGGQADPTNGTPIDFAVVFSEPVTGFTSADVTTAGSAATVGTVTVSGGPAAYAVAIAASGNGNVVASVVSSAAQDAAGNTSVASSSSDNSVTLDTSGPSVAITSPSSTGTFTTTASTVALGGTAADPAGVTSVSWANAANATSGAATGTTGWSVASVTLAAGANVITVTATDGLGNPDVDTITVTRSPPASCAAVLAATPGSPSGIYAIAPQGSPMNVYCDMTTDGGGWTLVFKWRSSDTNVSFYFNQLVTATEVQSTSPSTPPIASTEGLSSAQRQAVWASGATEYRMTAYDATAGVLLDGRKSTNLDAANTSFCAAAGRTDCTTGYSNATVGTITILGGSLAPAGSSNLYQLGYYDCNCAEGQWVDTHNNGKKWFGDYFTSTTVHTAFWVR